jgi:hypothetical protein
MPQITLYITKDMDAAWRAAPNEERAVITAKMRSLLRKRLVEGDSRPQEARQAAVATNGVESGT